MLSFIFNEVLYLSFLGTITSLVILTCRLITRNKFEIKFQYAIDFILIIRLLICFGITTDISIYNYVPSYSSTMMNIPLIENMENVQNHTEKFVQTQLQYRANIDINFFDVAIVIWVLGVVVISSFMILSVLKVNNNIKKSKNISNIEIINIFEKCKNEVCVDKKIKLIETNIVKSPCVYGFIRPKILVPKSILNCKEKINFKYIFLHELLHIKRHDILINHIIFYLNTIHWFNPIIMYSLNKMKDDMEIICDSEVLSILDKNEKISYGNLLLDLQEISNRAPWLPQMAGIINNKYKLKRRISMIKKFKKNTYSKLSILALAGIVIIGGTVLTEAKAVDTSNIKIGQIKEDKLDSKFVNDEEVIGKWEAVDFVENEKDFKPGVKSWGDELYLKDFIFLKDGKMAQPITQDITSDEVTPVEWLKWTKGTVIHFGDQTASSYKIKEIDGEKYMIYQWKSGDYIYRGETPWYYVLKQVK